jgi:hypothetical protein
MKKIAAALATIVVLMLATGLLLFRTSPKEAKRKAETAQQAKAERQESKAATNTREIVELAEQKNDAAREQLVNMYVSWAGNPDRAANRRAIIRQIIQNEEAPIALKMILTAVSRDPTPLKSDDMLSGIARDVAPIWKDESLFTKGMDLFRMSEDVKSQAMLAESLSVRLLSPPAGLEGLDNQKLSLVSDLSHVYREGPQDADLKTQLLRNIQSVGGDEMAELAVDPMNPRAAYYRRHEAEAEHARNTVPPPPR